MLLFCRIFELFKLKLKFASANAKGMERDGGRGGDECSVTACICEIRDKKSLAAAYLPSCAAKLAKRTAKMQITIKMRLTLFLVLLLLLFSLCVVIVFLFVSCFVFVYFEKMRIKPLCTDRLRQLNVTASVCVSVCVRASIGVCVCASVPLFACWL